MCDGSVMFTEQHKRHRLLLCLETDTRKKSARAIHPKSNRKDTEMCNSCHSLIMFLRTHIRLKVNLSCIFLKTTKQSFKMINKGRCPTVRHVPRTHRVAVDWLFDRITLDSRVQIWP